MAGLYWQQGLWFLLALFFGGILSFIRPTTYLKISYIFYFFNLILLVLVLLIGKKTLGAQRWLVLGPVKFQPSELMKMALIFVLSRWYWGKNPEQALTLKDLFIPFMITAVPAGLIIVQPDLGTGLILFFIFATMTFYRRLGWRPIAIIAVAATLIGIFSYEFGLKEYQKKRILTFLDPAMDVRGSGYNAIQSKIAIGSGKFFGKGFKKSSQASLQFLPENHTDFIFSVFNEEHGFFGSLVLISLYLILFLRLIWISMATSSFYDCLLMMGITSIFFWHTFINMGMVMGILPIVGIPLPLMSYGGTSLLTFGMCIGVATSISNNRIMF